MRNRGLSFLPRTSISSLPASTTASLLSQTWAITPDSCLTTQRQPYHPWTATALNSIDKVEALFRKGKQRIIKPMSQKEMRLGERDVVKVKNLQPGYKELHEHTLKAYTRIITANGTATFASYSWLFLTGQPLLESNLALATLIIGVGVSFQSFVQIRRNNYSLTYSLIAQENHDPKIAAIFAGPNPSIKYTLTGYKISGPIGDIRFPSRIKEETITRIKNQTRVGVPTCVMPKETQALIVEARKAWFDRYKVGFSCAKLIKLLMKNPKDKTTEDNDAYIALIQEINDRLTAAPLGEARQKYNRAMHDFSLETILKPEVRKGALSYLSIWLDPKNKPEHSDKKKLSVNKPSTEMKVTPLINASVITRVPRTSDMMILYKPGTRLYTVGGPCTPRPSKIKTP